MQSHLNQERVQSHWTDVRVNGAVIHFWNAEKANITACSKPSGHVPNVTSDIHKVTCGNCIAAFPHGTFAFPGSDYNDMLNNWVDLSQERLEGEPKPFPEQVPPHSSFALTATEHENCSECKWLAHDAAVTARVTGSTGSTYTVETNKAKHSATVSRVVGGIVIQF